MFTSEQLGKPPIIDDVGLVNIPKKPDYNFGITIVRLHYDSEVIITAEWYCEYYCSNKKPV